MALIDPRRANVSVDPCPIGLTVTQTTRISKGSVCQNELVLPSKDDASSASGASPENDMVARSPRSNLWIFVAADSGTTEDKGIGAGVVGESKETSKEEIELRPKVDVLGRAWRDPFEM